MIWSLNIILLFWLQDTLAKLSKDYLVEGTVFEGFLFCWHLLELMVTFFGILMLRKVLRFVIEPLAREGRIRLFRE